MTKFFKKNWFYVFIGIFIIINTVFLFNNFIISRNQKTFNQQFIADGTIAGSQIESSNLYNQPCPEISLISINNENINLKDLIGNIIIIKFSRFYKKVLPNLLYLEHLVGKFKDRGTSLIFINSLGKHYKKAINKICEFSYPIVEDNGSISGIFNAGPEDIIIIDRNFTIKFKDQIFNKSLIHNIVKKWVFNENIQSQNVSNEELALKIDQLSFYDVFDKKVKKMNQQILEKKTILTLFTSTCTGCEENYRIHLLKELSSKINQEKTQIILLFGIGNNAKTMRQYALINGWNELPITVGVINYLDEGQKNDYYKLFQLNIDPRTFILNKKAEVVFAENINNSRLINIKFLMRKK
jgi:hypothetical protein